MGLGTWGKKSMGPEAWGQKHGVRNMGLKKHGVRSTGASGEAQAGPEPVDVTAGPSLSGLQAAKQRSKGRSNPPRTGPPTPSHDPPAPPCHHGHTPAGRRDHGSLRQAGPRHPPSHPPTHHPQPPTTQPQPRPTPTTDATHLAVVEHVLRDEQVHGPLLATKRRGRWGTLAPGVLHRHLHTGGCPGEGMGGGSVGGWEGGWVRCDLAPTEPGDTRTGSAHDHLPQAQQGRNRGTKQGAPPTYRNRGSEQDGTPPTCRNRGREQGAPPPHTNLVDPQDLGQEIS